MTPTSTDPRPTPDGPDGLHDPAADASPPDDGIVRMSKLNLSLLAFALVSICAGLYLSPVSSPLRDQVKEDLFPAAAAASSSTRPKAVAAPTATGSARPTATTTTPKPSASPARPVVASGGSDLTSRALLRRSVTTVGPTAVRQPVVAPAKATVPAATKAQPAPTASPAKPSPAPSASPAKTKCEQFAWQQDAQAVYAANLSDPYGLDGEPGPYDSDGIACTGLPVDPSRSASTPVGQYVAPSASPQTKAALVSSTDAFYGFTQDGLPGDISMFNDLETSAGKAPSSVGWYQSFDQDFRGDLVKQSWSRGALPVFTWMPLDSGSGTSYSLSTIGDGTHDAYLRKFAGDVVRTNLPVVIRFGHEMNGSWYGWSAGQTAWNNSPDKFKAAWIHIWQVFESVGANDNAIWLWSPSRIDNLKPSSTNGVTAMGDDYPGDQYVDWVGASIYLRHAKTGPEYAASFGKTIAALEAVTDKRLFFAEVGSIETEGTTDEATLKATFIHNTLTAFAADPRIVGFLWNNNVSAQAVDGQQVTNDWRFNSNPSAAQQFVADIANARFRTGLNTTN